jgi:hypothetical protein
MVAARATGFAAGTSWAATASSDQMAAYSGSTVPVPRHTTKKKRAATNKAQKQSQSGQRELDQLVGVISKMQNEQNVVKDRFQLWADYVAATLRSMDGFNAISNMQRMSAILHTGTMIDFVGPSMAPDMNSTLIDSIGNMPHMPIIPPHMAQMSRSVPVPRMATPPPQMPSPGPMTLEETEAQLLTFMAEGELDGEPPQEDDSEIY